MRWRAVGMVAGGAPGKDALQQPAATASDIQAALALQRAHQVEYLIDHRLLRAHPSVAIGSCGRSAPTVAGR
jgi:hypothetical protein